MSVAKDQFDKSDSVKPSTTFEVRDVLFFQEYAGSNVASTSDVKNYSVSIKRGV